MKTLHRRLVAAIALAALGMSGSALSQQPADCSAGPIPDQALELTIGSEKIPSLAWVSVRKISEMRLDDDVYEQYELTAQDKEMFANFEAGFSVIVPKGERPDGKTFRRLPTSKTDAQPGPEGLPEVQSWTVKHKARDLRASHVGFIASLPAEFGQRRGDVLPGRAYLCVPGGQTERMFGTKLPDPITFVGRFEARVR